MMNKLLSVPQHNLPTDTPSGCFSDLLHCLLCGGTVSTRSSVSSPTPHLASVSRKFVDLLQNDHHQQTKVELPIVARLMGLETPVDMNWKPRVIDESFNRRSRSVNSVDCLLPHFISPERVPALLHRRVKTCLSFRERDLMVGCVAKNSKSISAQCDQKRVNNVRAEHQSVTYKNPDGFSSSRRRRSNACVKSESRRHFEQTRPSTDKIKSDAERKSSTICRTARATWQNKDDYYRKPQAAKSQPRTKETQRRIVHRSSKSMSRRKNVNDLSGNLSFQEISVSGRLCSRAARSGKVKARTDNTRLRSEERRRDRKIKTADSHGEMQCIIEQDLEMKRWNWENEGGFMYREYLSMLIELGILDEIVNQMVQDLV